MSYTQPTTEMIDAARHADLCEYFKKKGYEVEQRRDELHIKGYGGLYINTDTNEWYCFSQSDKKGGRNAINCLTDVIGMDFKTAVSELAGYSYTRPISPKRTAAVPERKGLSIPESAENMKKVFAYLCQTRMLDSKIVSELAHEHLLYQDKKGNAVFLHKNDKGEIIGAEIQGTNTYQRFKGIAQGTADSVFSFKIGTPDKAYIFESAIDLLSFRQLASPSKLQDSLLVSMAGLKPFVLQQLSERGLTLYACVDNDEAGSRFISDNKLTPCNKVLSDNGVKDYNELLQKIVRTREKIHKPPTENLTVTTPPHKHKVRR